MKRASRTKSTPTMRVVRDREPVERTYSLSPFGWVIVAFMALGVIAALVIAIGGRA